LAAMMPTRGRGDGRPSTAEMCTTTVGAFGLRPYAIYLSRTQELADRHVETVADLIQSPEMERDFPAFSDRAVNKYGTSRGWRRSRLRTRSGFTLDALGLDSGVRGVKVENVRPGLLVIDDVDDPLDSPAVGRGLTAKIVRGVLPAGASDLAVLAVQNLVHHAGFFGQLVAGTADYLQRRHLVGPVPVLVDPVYDRKLQPDGTVRDVVVAGTPSWAGRTLAACQEFIDTVGLAAFKRECQHEVLDVEGSLYEGVEFRRCTRAEVPWPELERIVVWVDPAVEDSDRSDCHAMQCDALGDDGIIYRLASWEQRATPVVARERAIVTAIKLQAESVGVETNQGGLAWRSVYREAAQRLGLTGSDRLPPLRVVKAGQGTGPKAERQGRMVADYQL